MKAIAATMLTAAALLAGCQSAATSPEYMSDEEYLSRPELTESLFPGDQAVLSDKDIVRALESKITLPDPARLALYRLPQQWRRRWWSEDLVRTDDEIIGRQLTRLSACDRVADASVLPGLLMPRKTTVPHLRAAAARYQAHLLLAYRVHTETYNKSRWLARSKAKAFCVVDAVLIDVRTGIIPFGAVATETCEARETGDDISFVETVRRAEIEAVGQALDEITDALTAYLQAVP
jgi:hypothetical protein